MDDDDNIPKDNNIPDDIVPAEAVPIVPEIVPTEAGAGSGAGAAAGVRAIGAVEGIGDALMDDCTPSGP